MTRTKLSRQFLISFICVFASLSITVNAASPSCVSNLFSQVPLGKIIENQNILQVYSKMAVIPINIVNRLMGAKVQDNNIVKTTSPMPDKKDAQKTQNTSDVSFVNFQITENLAKTQSASFLRVIGADTNLYYMAAGHCLQRPLTGGGGACVITMFMLMFLIALRRCSLPAPNNKLFYNNITQSSVLTQDWVFYYRRF